MKRTKPTFGTFKFSYQLKDIFSRAVTEFENADSKCTQISEGQRQAKIDSDEVKLRKLKQNMYPASLKRIEAGAVLLMTAGALLEQIINDYAHKFLDPEAYEEHLDNLRAVSKWIVLPHLCQNKVIGNDNPAINSLRELIKARNAVVHSKGRELEQDPDQYPNNKAMRQTDREAARFLSACRKASTTIDALIKILGS